MSEYEDLLGSAHLLSPAGLAHADTGGKYLLPPHLAHLNRELVRIAYAQEGQRAVFNLPQQHGKSTLVSKYYPAWRLLNWPQKRIVFLTYEDDYAASFGMDVRDVLERWGGSLGIRLKRDTKAKGEWRIEGHDGGMVCCGRGGGVGGRPADDFLIDDLIKNAEEALSDAVLDANRRLLQSVVLGRLRRQTHLIMVGTRWSRKDHFAFMADNARKTGEAWAVVKYKALAEAGDVLGRSEGAPLWPEMVPLRNLEIARATAGRFWRAAWQQEPEDEAGAHFKPWGWPRYVDLTQTYGQRCWALDAALAGAHRAHGQCRMTVFPREATVLVTVDWAMSQTRWSDYTSFGAFALLGSGVLLVLEVVRERWPLEQVVNHLGEFCRRWRPDLVACEADGFQAALALECRRHADVGEVRRLKSEGKGKLQRAFGAVMAGENGRILLPEAAAWLDGFCTRLGQFTGQGREDDDEVDVLSSACRLARDLARPSQGIGQGPVVLLPGKEPLW